MRLERQGDGVGDLAADTAVEPVAAAQEAGAPRAYLATLSPDWEIWGPNGGYLAAVMLRAAGAASSFDRPATFTCHYHRVAAFREVELTVEVLRSGRAAESLRVSLTQDGASVAEAMLWSVAADLEGLEHDVAAMPDVPPPDEVAPTHSFPFPFWNNFERRPLGLRTAEEWLHREPADPVSAGWFRYVPVGAFDDPWLEAGRLAILLDTMHWPAAVRAHRERDLRLVAPSLDVSIQFHRDPDRAEWLFVEAVAPVAAHGLVGGVARVWAQDGRLLATARQQMLCRPLPTPDA